MRKELVAFISGVPAAGVFDSNANGAQYNCTNAGGAGGVGDYFLTIGQGGVDGTVQEIVVQTSTAVAVAQTAIPSVEVTSQTDTIKRIQFRSIAGALIDPTAICTVTIYRVHLNV